MPRILVKHNDRVIDQYVVDKGLFKVGRTPDNDIVLNDPSVSRSHLELKIDGNKITVTDLGSSNGTYVNGLKISRIISSKANIGVGVYNLEVMGLGSESSSASSSQPEDNVEATMLISPESLGDSAGRGGIGSDSPTTRGSTARPGDPSAAAVQTNRFGNSANANDDDDEKKNWLGRLFKKK